jgi:hypothetical protein
MGWLAFFSVQTRLVNQTPKRNSQNPISSLSISGHVIVRTGWLAARIDYFYSEGSGIADEFALSGWRAATIADSQSNKLPR